MAHTVPPSFRLATIAMFVLFALVGSVACGQAAAPTPTVAPKPAAPATAAPKPAAPTAAPAAPAPTKAPAAQSTPAPAPKVAFPEKGKSITLIVPWPAGGIMDVSARILGPALEKELGVPFVVVNKAGASGQIGASDLVRSKPDGYTLGYIGVQATAGAYLDPRRKASATYSRKDFQSVVLHDVDPETMSVKKDSPIKSLKELVDMAKAKPQQIKVGTVGVGSNNHMAASLLEKAAGISFNFVHFDGGPPVLTALLGGHIDVAQLGMGVSLPQAKSGETRLLGVYDSKPSRFFPSVPTMEQQGYKVYFVQSRGFSVPTGTPAAVVDIIAGAFKKVMEDPAVIKKFDEAGLELRYGGPKEFDAAWDEIERQIEPLLAELVKEGK